MMNVGGNDSAAAGYFAAHQFGLNFFALGHEEHLFGDDTFACQVHLRHIASTVSAGLIVFAFFDPIVTQCHDSPRESGLIGWLSGRQRSVSLVKTNYGIG